VNTWRVAGAFTILWAMVGCLWALMGTPPAYGAWWTTSDSAPAQLQCVTAFNDFMDMTVRLGFICQGEPVRRDSKKFVDFLYDFRVSHSPLIRPISDGQNWLHARATLSFGRTLLLLG
jgi:hypothetical protein